MKTRVLMISHAATAAMREGRMPGDDALEARDIEAARAFGQARLTPHGAARVVTSPARSARETTHALGLQAQDEPALADLDYGSWRGRSLKEIAAETPDAFVQWTHGPTLAPHGGESFRDLVERVASWLDSVGDETVVAVTHAVVVRAALVRVLEMPLGAFTHIELAPLSVVDLRRSPRGWAWWAGTYMTAPAG